MKQGLWTILTLAGASVARAQAPRGDTGPGCAPPSAAHVEPYPCDCEAPGPAGSVCPVYAGPPPPRVKRDWRPVVLVNCMNGNERSARLGAPWWDKPDAEGAAAGLVARLDNCFHRGFRRMVLYMPAGQDRAAAQGALFASGQYWSMPCALRNALARRLGPWLARREKEGQAVTLGVYGGSWYSGDVASLGMSGARPFDVGRAEHVRAAWLNIHPWAALGAREYWLDYSSPKPCVVGALQLHPDFTCPDGSHVRFGGEAIPGLRLPVRFPGQPERCMESRNRLGQMTPDANRLVETPWVCTLPYAQDTFPTGSLWGYEPDVWRLADRSGKLVPRDTELGMIIQDRNTGAPYRATIEDAVRMFRADAGAHLASGPWRSDAGWVLWAGNEAEGDGEYHGYYRYLDILQRVYDMGSIACAADYNADGVVDQTDLDLAYGAIEQNLGAQNATYLMGDFNGDRVVTSADKEPFQTWWTRATRMHRYMRRDLGAPGP